MENQLLYAAELVVIFSLFGMSPFFFSLAAMGIFALLGKLVKSQNVCLLLYLCFCIKFWVYVCRTPVSVRAHLVAVSCLWHCL